MNRAFGLLLAWAAAALPSSPRTYARVPRAVVVIDAGHGGRDVGAIGLDGTFEKTITLAIAKRVVAGLALEGGIDAQMTRASDRFVTLDDRVKFARRHQAALFLSIHADSAPGTPARGWTLYTVSDAASTVAAARLARRENVSLFADGPALDADTAFIFGAVVENATSNATTVFRNGLEQCLQRFVRLRPNGARKGAFWVLKAADVPSLLIETGYMSSRTDLAYLESDTGQAALARAIVAAVRQMAAHRALSTIEDSVTGASCAVRTDMVAERGTLESVIRIRRTASGEPPSEEARTAARAREADPHR